MSEAIERVLKLKADSYQVFLREASLLAPPLLKGQSWADVQQLMTKHGFTVARAWENGDAVHSHHLAKKNAFILPSGRSLDLRFELSARNLDRGRSPARPGELYAANVVLVSELGAPYSEVMNERRFPEGSVLDAVLRSEPVKEAGATWPVSKSISVHYGYIGNRREEHNPSGFHVTIEFVASTTEAIGGKRMYLYAASGLDPLRSRDGKEVLRDGFKARDTIEEIQESGGNEWWHGAAETVEANQRKYLKKQASP